MKIKPLIGACAFTLAAGSLSLDAQNLNGTVNSAFYGSPVAIQTINTGFGNAAGGNDSAGGSELDALTAGSQAGIYTCSWRETLKITAITSMFLLPAVPPAKAHYPPPAGRWRP